MVDIKRWLGFSDGTRQLTAGAVAGLPSYAPTTGTLNRYDPATGCYNFRSRNLRTARAQAHKAALGVRTFEVLAVGDSTLIEYDGSNYTGVESTIPRQFGKALSSSLGGVPMTDGHRLIVAAASSALNGSCSAPSGWVITDNFAYSNAAAPLTINPMDVGTAVEFTYSNASVNNFTYSIDGEVAVPVTTTGAATFAKVTRTGLTYGKHTLVINGQTSAVIPFTYCVWDPTTPSIRVHNLGLGGSKAATSPAGQNMSDTTANNPVGYGSVIKNVMSVIGVTPDFLLVSTTSNDIAAGTSAATAATGATVPRTYFPGVQGIWLHCYQSLAFSSGSTADNAAVAQYNELSTRFFTDIADTLDVAMFDWNDWVGTRTGALSDGVIGADNTHPTNQHKTAVGRLLATAFLGLDAPSPVVPQIPMQLNRSATLYEGWFQSDPTTVGNIAHTLPANPRNGCIVQVAHSGTANTVSLALGSGQTFEGSAVTLAFGPNERGTFTYRASDKTWTMRRFMSNLVASGVVRDNNLRAQFADPAAAQDAATKAYADSRFTIPPMSYSGPLSLATGQSRFYNRTGRTLTITEIFASVGTAPTGASVILDVKKNGTTLYTTTANRPTIAAGANTSSTTQPDVTTLAQGDYLTMDITQIGSTVPGSDLVLQIRSA